MVDQHRHSVSQLQELRSRPRWGSLANERALLDLLENNQTSLQPTALTLAPVNANIYARRHSSHTCPATEEPIVKIPPPVPLRPPAVPKRTSINATNQLQSKQINRQIPSVPPSPRNRALPPIPTDLKPIRSINRNPVIQDITNNLQKRISQTRNVSPKQINKPSPSAFEFGSNINQEFNKFPPAPVGPPPPAPKSAYKPPISPAPKPNPNQQSLANKFSMRQDSSVSSDSFSQTSSPSYTTKTMETPLIPPRTPIHKQNGVLSKSQQSADDANGNGNIITKSVSTPASLQTIVRFHNGSNMSLHHRIIRDMRRPSSHYIRRVRVRFRYAQIMINALALIVIGGGMAAYFKAYPTSVQVVNTTHNGKNFSPIYEQMNPAPGVCLIVIVNFCHENKIPYNYTVFPNYMGHFGQREAESELEAYDAVVDVRCYELAALFLCSVFVPKCGPGGSLVRPCRSLCLETKRRCGFFLDVFGLSLPDYLECALFPESTNPEVCIGHYEVKEAKMKSLKPVCPSGFQCDVTRCIPKDWRCDGHVDCKDQTDELNCRSCGHGMIHCGEDKCISQDHMCDGLIDCPWSQDERNCLRLSEKNGDEGRGQLEVFKPNKQAWIPACIANVEEKTPDNICLLLGYAKANDSVMGKANDIYEEDVADWKSHQTEKNTTNWMRDFASCKACGKTRKTYAELKPRVKRIIGGVRSKPGDWPFLAALLGGPEEIFYCAGVLIADQWVLTASHCVGNHSNVTGWTIQLGITRRIAHAYYGQKMKVKRVVPHPMYNLEVPHDNDVALFQLSSSVTFHEHLLPVCLPPANKDIIPGTVCTVIGWGKKEDTGKSEYELDVHEVEVPVLNRDLCNTWLKARDLNVTDGMICAGYEEGGKDACQVTYYLSTHSFIEGPYRKGDSGGPLLCRDEEDPEKWFVGGIVSWGIKCAHPQLPGVYAYVPKYIPWILEQIRLYED